MPDYLDLSPEVIEMYKDSWVTWVGLDRRFLPRGGGYEDQPALQMKTFALLDNLLECIRKQRKSQEPKE